MAEGRVENDSGKFHLKGAEEKGTLGGGGTLGSDVTLKKIIIFEPFVRFKKFKWLNRLDFNFLLVGQTVQHLP